jgi:hypothetical protein
LFRTGGTLSPRDINENLTHMQTLVRDAQQQRYLDHVLRFPLQTSLDAPYTNASPASRRTYRVRFPNRLIIERAYLRFYGSGTAPVTVFFSFGTLGSNAFEYLTVTPTASDEQHTAFNGRQLRLEADNQLNFEVSGTSFTSKASYIELHLRADRFNVTGTELAVPYEPALFRGGETRDAARILAETAKIDAAVDSVVSTSLQRPLRSEQYVVHDVADSPARYTWRIPGVSVASGDRRRLTGYRVWATRDPALGTASTTVHWRLLNGSTVLETWTLNLGSSVSQGTVGGPLASPRSLQSGTNGYLIECEGDPTTSMLMDKTYLQLFYS